MVAPSTQPVTSLSPVGLRISGAESGFIGHSAPEFSWQLACHRRHRQAAAAAAAGGHRGCVGVRQVAFQVTVHEIGASNTTSMMIYDSGRVESPFLRHLAWLLAGEGSSSSSRGGGGGGGGESSTISSLLRSDSRYSWHLRVWVTAVGEPTVLFGEASETFHTALLRLQDWNGAQWIGGGTAIRTGFVLEAKKIASATAYASGAGCFALTVNGAKATEAFLEPSWANLPPARMLYRAYNVAALLQSGKENALGIRLGMCKVCVAAPHPPRLP